MTWLALDIGGANLKLADGQGYAASWAFALWRSRGQLSCQLRSAIAESPRCDHLAVTMTGELADCFDNRIEGVTFILDAVDAAADGRHTRVYLHDGRLVTPAVAKTLPLLAASSNWHVLANFCGRHLAPHGPAMLIDIGSTTADIVPLRDGKPACQARHDHDRLLAGELVYTGIERTPVSALVSHLPWRGVSVPVVPELFATTRDAYLLRGDLPSAHEDCHTADGRPATAAAAARRLGRTLCLDATQFTAQDAQQWARTVADAQLELLRQAMLKVAASAGEPPRVAILSGHGEFLGRKLWGTLHWPGQILSLGAELGPSISRCAPAHALAILAREASGV